MFMNMLMIVITRFVLKAMLVSLYNMQIKLIVFG